MIPILLFVTTLVLLSHAVSSVQSKAKCWSANDVSITPLCYEFVSYNFIILESIAIEHINKKAEHILAFDSYANTSVVRSWLLQLICGAIYIPCRETGSYLTSSKNHYLLSQHLLTSNNSTQNEFPIFCSNRQEIPFTNLGKNCTEVIRKIKYLLRSDERIQEDAAIGLKINELTTTLHQIGYVEPYLYANDPTGACYGITEHIFIPSTPSHIYNHTMKNQSQPFYIQSLLESSLQLRFSKVHVWITEECDIAMKKYFCSSTMIAPQWLTRSEILSMNNISDRSDLMIRGGGVYVPSYPHHSVCTEYASVCGDYISRSGLEFLKPDCDAIVVSGRRIDDVEMAVAAMMFPSSNQTVYTAQMFINDNNSSSSDNIYHLVNISLISSPNTLSEVDESRWSHHHPDCPSGFVVPDDKTDPDVRWVPGSGCAVACKSPIWTEQEWLVFDVLTRICVVLGVLCGTPFVITWTVVKEKRKQYLVLCFAMTSTIATFSFVPFLFMTYEQRFCRNNAVSYNASDGFTMCAVQSVILLYSANGMYLSWLCLCIDIFLQLCRKNSRTYELRGLFMSIIFGLPLINCIVMIAKGEFGYYSGTMECYAMNQNNFDVYLFTIPSLLICITGGVLMTAVILKIGESIKRTSAMGQHQHHVHKGKGASGGVGGGSGGNITFEIKKLLRKFDLLKVPVYFVVILFSASAGVFALRGGQFVDPTTLFVNVDWQNCIFDNFQGDDASWKRICGSHAKYRTHPLIAGYFMCCSAGGSILVSSIYILNPSVLRIWKKALGCVSSSVMSDMSIFRKSSAASFAFVPGFVFDLSSEKYTGIATTFRRFSVDVKKSVSAVQLYIPSKEVYPSKEDNKVYPWNDEGQKEAA